MKTFGQISAFLLACFFGSLWSGWVLSVLWGWFVVTQFEAAPQLSIAGAIGISLIVSYLTQRVRDTDSTKSSRERIIESFVEMFTRPLFALIIGWIVRMFM